MADFTSIPLLDYSTLSVDRAKFIAELRNVATNIGFMTLKNTPVPWALVEKVLSYTPALFNLPFSDKVKVEMATNPHFLGYNRLGYEITKGEMDLREQWDFGPEYPSRWQKRGDPIHHRVHGPGVWPEETQENGLVGFKATTLEYIRKVTDFSYEFLRLIEEAVGLKPGALDVFSDDQTRGGGSIKLVRYPPASPDFTTNQGVGAHKDPYITFLVQGDELPGLQVQNGRGEWIDCPPKPECFVVNFGTILETATHGRVIATTHRVLSPPSSYTKPRTSMPFFQRIALDALVVPLPASAFYEPPSSASYAKSDAAPNQYPVIEEGSPVWGALYLANRLRSHPDCGYAHYPDLMPSVMKGFESMHPVEVARRKALEQGGQNEARL